MLTSEGLLALALLVAEDTAPTPMCLHGNQQERPSGSRNLTSCLRGGRFVPHSPSLLRICKKERRKATCDRLDLWSTNIYPRAC